LGALASSDDFAPPPPARKPWVWYFLGIALVAGGLLLWLALWIQHQMGRDQQLQVDQILAARKLWETKKIDDYQMVYTVQRGGDSKKDQYYVDVRGGKVRSVIFNGKEPLAESQLEYHSMAGLFNDIERFLWTDAQRDSPQTFCRGYFDTQDGHLLLFVRRVVGRPESVEIKVEEFRPGDGK
jgi:Family of unknown function (DUF6174)